MSEPFFKAVIFSFLSISPSTQIEKIGFWESGKYSFSNPSMKSFKSGKTMEHKDNFQETDVCYR